MHDEILLVWLWALYSTSRVTHWVSCWPEVELSEADGLPREWDILEASPPWSAVLHSTGISQKQWFLGRMLVFQLLLVFYTRMMPCGPENKETCWLVSEDPYLWILVLGGVVIGRSVTILILQRDYFSALRGLQVTTKRRLCVNVLSANEAKIFNELWKSFPVVPSTSLPLSRIRITNACSDCRGGMRIILSSDIWS